MRIKVGEAFDVVADRRQMEWKAISSCTSESAWKIELRNHKDDAVEVDVLEPASGDWEILQSSHPATKEDAHRQLACRCIVEERAQRSVVDAVWMIENELCP